MMNRQLLKFLTFFKENRVSESKNKKNGKDHYPCKILFLHLCMCWGLGGMQGVNDSKQVLNNIIHNLRSIKMHLKGFNFTEGPLSIQIHTKIL